MSASSHRREKPCGGTAELVAWYPTATLSPEKKRHVEAHVAECASCKSLLDFATQLKLVAPPVLGEHPAPKSLVQFSTNPKALPPNDRTWIEKHLEECPSCSNEVRILDAVDIDEPLDKPIEREARVITPTTGVLAFLGRWWMALSNKALQPVPTVAYLAVFSVAVVLVVVQTGGIGVATRAVSHVDGIVLLPDRLATANGGSTGKLGDPVIKAESRGILVIELTDLARYPHPADLYRVELTRRGADTPAWEGLIMGGSFSGNYTISVTLEPGTLDRGEYRCMVTDPEGSTVYQAAFNVR